MKKGWYEKYIGYCFNDNGKEVILNDVYKYDDGRLCFEMTYTKSGHTITTDYKGFMTIRKQTNLPR